MRALRFTKIDFIKTKKQMWCMPAFLLLLAVIAWNGKPEDHGAINIIMVFLYMIFITIIFSTTPFGSCRVEENGFLLLLPATTRDRVLGRFLYGLALMAFAVVCGIGAAVIYSAFGYRVNEIQIALCLIGFAVGNVIMTAEYVFFYLCGESQAQSLLSIVRVLPGMCFFFATMNLSKEILQDPVEMENVLRKIGTHLTAISWGSAIASLVILMAAVALCVKVIKKRGY